MTEEQHSDKETNQQGHQAQTESKGQEDTHELDFLRDPFILFFLLPIMVLLVIGISSGGWISSQEKHRPAGVEQSEQVANWIARYPQLREPLEKRLQDDCKGQAAPCLSRQEYREVRDRYQALRQAQIHRQLQEVVSEPSAGDAAAQGQTSLRHLWDEQMEQGLQGMRDLQQGALRLQQELMESLQEEEGEASSSESR